MFKFLKKTIGKKGNDIPEKKQYRTGLALSGGGARGFSHLGSVKALLENGYQFDIISGTSIGAIVGCVLADGFRPDEVMSILADSGIKSFLKPNFSRTSGLMKLNNVKDFLAGILKHERIEDLPTPFVATATNLDKGEAHYFRKGNLLDAVMASASIPLVFPPVIIDGEQYVDGAIINNLPVRPIRPDCDIVVGISVNPSNMGLRNGSIKGFAQIAERTFHLAITGNVLIDENLCDIFIQHEELSDYTIFNFSKAKDIFTIGYEKTSEALAKMKKNG